MQTASPCALVIFGASGDLAKRKLIPALYELAREKLLPQNFALIGFARTEMSDDDYRKECRESLQKFKKELDPEALKRLEASIGYVAGDYGDAGAHERLIKKLNEVDKGQATAGNVLFYLSTPPNTFEPIIKCLGEKKAAHKGFQRIIIEKPFGRDLESAKQL